MICRTIAGQNVEITNPAILDLVDDLGLVPGRRPNFFCDRYRAFLLERKRESERFKRAFYERNKKYSRVGRTLYQDIVTEYRMF